MSHPCRCASLDAACSRHREEIQHVVNLILNAEHAIRAAGRPATPHVRTGSSGDSVFLEIADEAPGVPRDVVAQIFEPFFTTIVVGEGTGLGLSVSLGIAEAHAGSLALVPTDRGARFALTLPLAPIPAVSVTSETASL